MPISRPDNPASNCNVRKDCALAACGFVAQRRRRGRQRTAVSCLPACCAAGPTCNVVIAGHRHEGRPPAGGGGGGGRAGDPEAQPPVGHPPAIGGAAILSSRPHHLLCTLLGSRARPFSCRHACRPLFPHADRSHQGGEGTSWLTDTPPRFRREHQVARIPEPGRGAVRGPPRAAGDLRRLGRRHDHGHHRRRVQRDAELRRRSVEILIPAATLSINRARLGPVVLVSSGLTSGTCGGVWQGGGLRRGGGRGPRRLVCPGIASPLPAGGGRRAAGWGGSEEQRRARRVQRTAGTARAQREGQQRTQRTTLHGSV